MADKYITSLASILAGLELELDPLQDPVRGYELDKVRCYLGEGYADSVSHADEESLIFVQPAGDSLIVILAPAEKAIPLKEFCDKEGVACHYELRGGRVVFRCQYLYGLHHELINLLNADSANDEVVFYEASKSDDESDDENGFELDLGDLSAFPD